MNIISREQIFKEKVNLQNFRIDNIELILTYYMQILDFVCNIGLISGFQKKQITEFVLSAIEERAERSAIRIANIMYIVTLYLLSKPNNWEAWQTIFMVDDRESANKLISDSINWYQNEMKIIGCIFHTLKKNVYQLNNDCVAKSYNELVSIYETMQKIETEECNLKQIHFNSIVLTNYIFVGNDKFSECLDVLSRLKNRIDSFVIETQILLKIGKEALEFSKYQQEQFEKSRTEQTLKLNAEFEEKLAKLKEEYLRKLQNCKLDSVKVTEKYESQKLKIQEQWSKQETKLTNLHFKEIEMMGLCDITDIVSLEALIKEYALYVKAKNGEIVYPNNFAQKSKMIDEMFFPEAKDIFIKENTRLTEAEVKYLRGA